MAQKPKVQLSQQSQEHKVKQLNLLTDLELQEMIQRQSQILLNKKFIARLPDGGEKIKTNIEKLKAEYEKRTNIEKMFAAMAINGVSKSKVQDIEWMNRFSDDTKSEVLDSDDEEEAIDPIKIIAQSTDAKKKIVVLRDESLINDADLLEIESFKSAQINENDEIGHNSKHVQYVCEMMSQAKGTTREPFKPYKTTKSDVHDYEKDRLRNQKKHWDLSAATPPPLLHGPVKEIPIMESLKLQEQHNKQLKEIQARQAAEKLAAQLGTSIGDVSALSISTNVYRNPKQLDSDDSDENEEPNSEDEVHDDDPEDKGGVSFPIEN